MKFSHRTIRYIFLHVSAIFVFLAVPTTTTTPLASAATATTTVRITICGDGLATGFEFCDSGAGNNTGAYATTTAGRHCNSSCMAYGQYCGDSILQPLQGEQCDDGNNTSGDRCSEVCVIENIQGGGGGGGNFPGGSFFPTPQTRITIQGKAYPGASVNILKDGEPIGIVEADGKADFYFTTTNITPGVSTFGFWAEDNSGLKSVALTTTLTVVSGAATTISGAFVPPTISLDKRKVNKGDVLNVSGQSAPSVTIVTHVHSDEEVIRPTTADASGKWKLAFDTSPLKDEDFHTAKALFETKIGGNVVKSSFSQSLSFYVGSRNVGGKFIADLNNDNKVNLIDVSILLFYWGTASAVADLNEDKRVNLSDFSIMLFYWTG